MFVIKRIKDGKWAARRGMHHAYTYDFRAVRVFSTRDEAERNACGNKVVEEIQERK